MRKFILLTIATLAVALPASATQVILNTAGDLHSKLTDKSVTSVVIRGTMDARDFKYIADNLDQLTSINLADVTIEAYSSSTPLIGDQLAYEAGVIPATSFFGKPLTSVTLPARLQAVGYAAFAGCKGLVSITLPPSLDSIGSYAFSGTGLTAITIPEQVTRVGKGAFSHCASLTTMSQANGIVGDFAFLGDTKLTSVTLGSGITAIGAGAFSGCSALTTVDLSQLTQLESIGDEAFVNTAITGINAAKSSRLATVGNYAFASTQVASAALGSSVNAIGEGAFYGDKKLTSFNTPASETSVGDAAFASTGLSGTLTMGPEVTTVGDYAYYNVDGVTAITIPPMVSHIGTKAMAGMTGLTLIDARPATVPELGDSVWAGVDQPSVELDAPSPDYGTAEQWKEFKFYQTYVKGDVNGDALVNVSDVATVISNILGQNPSPFNSYAADCNGDGVINVTDVTAIVNLILTGTTTTVKKPGMVNTDDVVRIPNFSINPGETRTIDIDLNNEQGYAAMQCDLHLPAGLTIVEGSLQATRRSAPFTFMSRVQPGGALRIVGFNMGNVAFSGNEGAVLHLTVKADAELLNSATIEVDNVVLATSTGQAFYPGDTQALVSSTSGVDDMNVAGVKVYTRGGSLVIDASEACTAQLVAMNGTYVNLKVEAGHNEYEDFNTGFYIVRLQGKSYKVAIK